MTQRKYANPHIQVTCPQCRKQFRAEMPTAEQNYIVKCPWCGANCRTSPNTNALPEKQATNPSSKKVVKRVLLFLGIIGIIILICVAVSKSSNKTSSGSGDNASIPLLSLNTSDIPVETPAPTVDQTSGTIGDYVVTIKNTKITKNKYDGTNVIIVTYAFTNNSDNSRSFAWAIGDTLFQNGVEIPFIYSNWGLQDEYNVDNTGKEIKPGITLDVDCAYELNDTETNIDVELKETFSWSDEVLTYTIEL